MNKDLSNIKDTMKVYPDLELDNIDKQLYEEDLETVQLYLRDVIENLTLAINKIMRDKMNLQVTDLMLMKDKLAKYKENVDSKIKELDIGK